MELVYLWIEDYKNIQNQGFNFSLRFECDFDKEKNELTITENKEYNSIFPNNINITAIVGENGSGKSSVLETLYLPFTSKIYYIYIKNNKFYSNVSKHRKSCNYPTKQENIDNIIYMNKMFFLNTYDMFDTRINLYDNVFIDKNSDDKVINANYFHKNIIESIIKKECLTTKFFNPKNIQIHFTLVKKLSVNGKSNEIINFNDFIDERNINQDDINFISNYKIRYQIYLKSIELSEKKKSRDKIINNLKNFIKQGEEEILNYNYLTNNTKLIFNDMEQERIFKFLEKFKVEENQIEIEDFRENYLESNKEQSLFDVFYYLYQIGFLEYNIYDKIGRNFNSLSSGEKTLFTDFCLLDQELKKQYKNNNTNIILAFDEPDITLHPSWQKDYLNQIFYLLKHYKDINFHLIFTTHSPFLLSDLPKENIIFLKKGKQVYPDIETFGANIHTLLSHGFFMENGLMGEFAEEKINKVITLLNKSKLNEKDAKFCENIISITGEPILKRQMQKMLDSKEIDYIAKDAKDAKEEIELLKHKIDILSKRL